MKKTNNDFLAFFRENKKQIAELLWGQYQSIATETGLKKQVVSTIMSDGKSSSMFSEMTERQVAVAAIRMIAKRAEMGAAIIDKSKQKGFSFDTAVLI